MILLIAAAAGAVLLAGDGLAARQSATTQTATTEVVVTLKSPPLSSLGTGTRPAQRQAYARQLSTAQAKAGRAVLAAIPEARIRWHYRVVLNGFAVVLPQDKASVLAHVPGLRAWPAVTYESRGALLAKPSTVTQGPEVIGADKLWGPSFATAGNGVKIGIIDDGLDATHKYFDTTGFDYPPGFPKGQTTLTTPKVIVQRTFSPPSTSWRFADTPFDPDESFHATHVGGIAAGDHGTRAGTLVISGVAPNAYLGNYKALTVPTPNFGLDGNAAEIAAAIESAVADGMDVINLSLGEPEIEPSRDIVVAAIEGAAKAGVVPVIAAGNDFSDFGYGSISSPGNAPSAITVAAVTNTDVIASFSSAGPTPVSLTLKPDVSAPGVAITSSLPNGQGGPWGQLEGTSMATPQVAGGVALLRQQRPNWTPAQLKSALVQTADPVLGNNGKEVSVLREGGGLVDLPRALNPLLFAAPTGVTFPVNGGSQTVSLTDATGGAGTWTVTTMRQGAPRGIAIEAPTTVTVPGPLQLTATVAPSAHSGAVTGFVILTHGSDTRRIPFLIVVDRPKLSAPVRTLTRTDTYEATTKGAPSKVVRYRYPTAGDTSYPGPELVYRVNVGTKVANFGAVTLAGHAVPHVVYAGDENHLVGYTGLPTTLNPYFDSFGDSRSVAGAILPGKGAYDIVFDTRSAALSGPFRFRFWLNDTRPPTLRLLPSGPGTIAVAITDTGSGVDPRSLTATVDGHDARVRYADGRALVRADPGPRQLSITASDFQEAKNMEDVVKIRPNTATLTRTVTVR